MKRVILLCIVLGVATGLYAQSGSAREHGREHDRCLWAGLSVDQPLFTNDPSSSAVFSFALFNECLVSVDAHPDRWVLLINGQAVGDQDTIFGNGPEPNGGWAPLRPGASYRFTKSLPVEKYFPANGVYRISWRGDGFETPEVTLRVIGKFKLLPTR